MRYYALIFLVSLINTVFSQATTDIWMTTNLTNSENTIVSVKIEEGQIISHNERETSNQMFSVYNVETESDDVKIRYSTKDKAWYIDLDPYQKATVLLKVRCLNQGLEIVDHDNAIPVASKIAFCDAVDLHRLSQKDIWLLLKNKRK